MRYALMLAVIVTGCSAKKSIVSHHIIPTCGAEVVVPNGCAARDWGNATEIDCPGDPKVYYCHKLERPSPN